MMFDFHFLFITEMDSVSCDSVLQIPYKKLLDKCTTHHQNEDSTSLQLHSLRHHQILPFETAIVPCCLALHIPSDCVGFVYPFSSGKLIILPQIIQSGEQQVFLTAHNASPEPLHIMENFPLAKIFFLSPKSFILIDLDSEVEVENSQCV